MQASIHLTFCGQCRKAFRFYERCFGTTITLMLKYGDTPAGAGVPANWREKIVHSNLAVWENTFAGADVQPKDYESPKGFFCLLDIADPEEAERVVQRLAENGVVSIAVGPKYSR
jgi:PhnB protein